MIKKTLLLIVALVLTACGQEKKTIKKTNMKTQQDIYNLYKKIKYYGKQPLYEIEIGSGQFSYEILVNDISVYKFFRKLTGGPSGDIRPINVCITKAGKQKLTIKTYPGFDDKTNEFKKTLGNGGVGFKLLRDDVVVQMDGITPIKAGEEDFIFRTPQIEDKKDGGKIFPFPDKTYHEDTFYCNADIPYEITPVADSELLLTTDAQQILKLEKEVVAKYNYIRSLYLNDNATKDDIVDVYYERGKRYAQQMYLHKDAIKKDWDTETIFKTDPGITFFDLKPIEKYKMGFYGNGKLVSLVRDTTKESSLWGGVTQNDVNSTIHIPILLHCPKGSKGLVVY
jgi:hypothetical protein